MSGVGGLATVLRRGSDGFPCLVSALVDVLTLGPIRAGLVFFFVLLL